MQKSALLFRLCGILGLLLLLPAACSGAETRVTVSGSQMSAANALYEEGRYPEAAAAYQALVDSGVKDGRLFYNLGNAYFKSGDLGRAILNYRRALRLLPRDEDVVANLELARVRTLDQIETGGEGAVVGAVRQVFNRTTVDEAAIIALLLWFGCCGLLAGAILWRRYRRALLYLAGVLAGMLFLLLFSIGVRMIDQGNRPGAVVVADSVPLRSGPGEAYLTEFSLHAGAEVQVIERRAGWVRVTLPGELQGWAPEEAIAQVTAIE